MIINSLLGLILALAAQGTSALPDFQNPFTAAGFRFQRHLTADNLGREIPFYITENKTSAPLPIAIFILGSGSYSQFLIRDGKILCAQRDFLEVLNGRARVIIVDKIGIKFGEQPAVSGTAEGSSAAFRREHTLERWTQAISAALKAARKLPQIDLNRTLVIGHSEGAEVAAAVAAENGFVTHVACLNGAGPTQLFKFLEDAHVGKLYGPSVKPDEQVQRVLRQWAEIQNSSTDCNAMWLGHSYCYWATFMASSALEELPRTRARIFLASSDNGMEDESNMDLLRATLLAHGKDVRVALIKGADHAFQVPDHPERDGWRDMQTLIVDWFFSQ